MLNIFCKNELEGFCGSIVNIFYITNYILKYFTILQLHEITILQINFESLFVQQKKIT